MKLFFVILRKNTCTTHIANNESFPNIVELLFNRYFADQSDNKKSDEILSNLILDNKKPTGWKREQVLKAFENG